MADMDVWTEILALDIKCVVFAENQCYEDVLIECQTLSKSCV